MAMVIQEMFDSRRVFLAKDSERGVLEFVGYGTDDDAESRTAFVAAIPATFTFFVHPLTLLDFTHWTLGGKLWRATANYGPDPAPLFPAVGIVGPPIPVEPAPEYDEPLGPDYSFDFVGGTEHVTQSRRTISATGRNGRIPPNAMGAIGVTADNRVNGCERTSPNKEWSRTVTFQSITMQYIQTVAAMVGCTNNAQFYGKPPLSQVFVGGTAQTDDTSRARVTFKFLHRPNLTNIVICPGLTVPSKKGSEYLWVSYKPASGPDRVGAGANANTMQPDAAYVERIVDAVDFGQLRIGA